MGDTPIHICGAAPLSINAILPICEGLVAARMTLCAVVKYFPSSYTRDTSGKLHESFCRLKANQRFWIGNVVWYGQDNSVFANMDMYRIENVVCYPFRTATLVDNETIEDQIGKGARVRHVLPSIIR